MPSNKPGSRLIKAAGGVAWRPGPDGEPEILLVHRKKYDDWSLPKGKIAPGEPLAVTAVREVLEEGGAQLALGRRLASVRYSVGGRPKRVHYWVARVLSVDSRAVPNSEVDEVAWLPAAWAVDKVSYPRDHGVLADFAARPAGTVPLILLRHAKAVHKNGWKRADAVRPLDGSGRADARALADLLACFAPRQLISSTALRCTDTLRPLAKLTGLRLREEPSLFIHNQSSGTEGADPAAIAALVREVIASGEPTVLCAHRENIPALREAALAALGVGQGAPPAADRPAAGDPAVDGAAADGPATGGPATDGPAPDEGPAAGGPAEALARLSELPKDWADPLPTSGFWVLNIAPLPARSESAEPSAGPAQDSAQPPTGQFAASSPGPATRWWRRLRTRGSALAVNSASAPAPAVAVPVVPAPEVPVTGRSADAVRGDGPVGVLVSADRYDLSES